MSPVVARLLFRIAVAAGTRVVIGIAMALFNSKVPPRRKSRRRK